MEGSEVYETLKDNKILNDHFITIIDRIKTMIFKKRKEDIEDFKHIRDQSRKTRTQSYFTKTRNETSGGISNLCL
jgi:hypothetical protein